MTYSFINMMFISTGTFYDKLRPQIVLVDTTANAAVTRKLYMRSTASIICDNIIYNIYR
jgi:hypothetical protein